MASNKPIEILLVEDSPSDADLVVEAFGEHRLECKIHLVQDGEEAMAFLAKEGAWSAAPTPDIVLLDLNIPRKDGREVLQEIKASPTLNAIPVVIMTTSSSAKDVLKCYQLQASSYIIKPLNIDQFLEMMKILGDYWFHVVKLPNIGG